MYKLKYFKKSNDGICGSDLKNIEQIIRVNLQQISSISEVKKFNLPFSGKYIGSYAELTMQNGNVYYISSLEHEAISKAFN